MEQQKYPNWILNLVKLIRPFSILSFIMILIIGSIWFSLAAFFYPEAGKASMETFTGFFRAMDDNFYTTFQVMFATYVAGRSSQAIAKDFLQAKLVPKEEEDTSSSWYRHSDYYPDAGWNRPPPMTRRYPPVYTGGERVHSDESGGYG